MRKSKQKRIRTAGKRDNKMLLNATKRKIELPSLEEIKILLGWVEKEYGTKVIISFLAKMIHEHQSYNITDIINELTILKQEVKNEKEL